MLSLNISKPDLLGAQYMTRSLSGPNNGVSPEVNLTGYALR